jgi:argininosuccinate lyase
MFESALRSTRLLTGVLQTVEINVAKLAAQAAANFLTVTELADTLVRSTGISFRQAHSLVARAVKVCGNDDSPEAIARAIRALDPGLEIGDSDIENALDPLNFVRIRRVKGGPAPEVTAEAIDRAVFDQQRFVQWLAGKESLLKAAQRENREGSPGHTG